MMIEQDIKINEGGKFSLDGKITLPENGIDLPAVVLVHGSGSTDMDETVFELKPFRDIAEYLAQQGIASIRYHKRTWVYKDVRKTPYFSVKEETVDDAISAAKLIKQNPRVNPKKVFILGHSQGGMLAPRIDAEGGDFAGIIIMAGSPLKITEIILRQCEESMNKIPFILKPIGRWQIKKIRQDFKQIEMLSDDEANTHNMWGPLKQFNAYYFKEFNSHPPANYLSDTQKPIFIFQGNKDFQVSANVDFNEYKRILASNPKVTFKLYDGLNHLMNGNTAKGTIADYKIPAKVDEGVMKDIAEWITRQS
jgi:dienelactone hydrolase